ncbi:hypothetical protein C1752_14788 [Acaryochloris thomasi RCC1774]|uniref:Uncharacterized protein n=1 Tax=Acaryochloris thomasi RCC1774 TaxID=1764569 RepID=A0A2W1J6R3_9CYAN|nr:hypothetical protein [Acaryochloris thomasi]PZD70283.1 hypothetical protein C1752_14788 [Acaryochloris thomasi RCC1774]
MTEKIKFYPGSEAELDEPDVEQSSGEGVDTSPISIDIPDHSNHYEDEESLLPEDFDAEDLEVEQARTQRHPMQTPWTKMAVVMAGTAVAFGLLMMWYNSAKGVKLTKEDEKTERIEFVTKAEINQNSDRINSAVQKGNIERKLAAERLAEEEKKRQKAEKQTSTQRPPARPSTASRSSSPAPPPRTYRPPPPRPRIAARPAPPPPRPASRPAPAPQSAPRPAPAPVVAKAEPVDRSPVYGGQLPATQAPPTQPNQADFETELVSQEPEFNESYADNSPLSTQQSAFLQGQTLATIPSGTTLKADIQSEAIASDSATFTAITREEIAGIPKGAKVLAQIVQLAPGGSFEAEVIALNGAEIPPGSTRILRGNGKLMRAKGSKPKKGFFQSGLGRMITGFAQDAGESWVRDQVGGNRTISNGARDVLVLSDPTRTSRPPNPKDPREASVLIPTGSIEITFEQDTLISR